MGNMLPCLAHSTTTSTMNTTGRPQSSHYSIELLTRTIHIMARRRRLKIARDRRRKLQSAMAALRTLQRKICDGNNDNKKQPAAAGVVRVKVVLTRKQAARLVSLAGEGRRRTAVQLVRELRRMEDAGRVDGSSPATAAWRPVLETISEE